MNMTGEPGRFEADQQCSQVQTEQTEKITCGPDTTVMADEDGRISRGNEKNDKKLMDERIRKSSGPGRNLKR